MKNFEMSRLAISHGDLLHLPEGIAQNLAEVLLKTAKQNSTKGINYVQFDGTTNFQSYLELRETATKILTGLKQLGLKPKDQVILQLEQNQDFISAFWACILGGFVPIPLATATIYGPDNSAAKKLHSAWRVFAQPLVLTNEKLAAPIRNLAAQLKIENLKLATLEQLPSSASKTDYHSANPDEIALMLLTSGSTGIPKIVKLSHQNILHSIAATSQMAGFTSQDISLNWLPLDHPGPLIRCVIRMVYLGCQQIHAPTAMVLQEPLQWLDWLERYRVTTTWAPNFAFALLNDRATEIKKRHWNLTSLKSLLNTAEPIVPQTAIKLWELLSPYGLSKTAMHSSWGMAETSSGVTHSEHYLSDFSRDENHENNSFAELGLPVPGISLRIVDEQDRIVTEQTIGYLQVKGATVTSGYEQNLVGGNAASRREASPLGQAAYSTLSDSQANQEAFTADGWFKTGDLGFLAQGRLTITGRNKDVIIINGNNYYSHEIESIVEEIAGVEISYTAACGIRQPNSNTDRLAIFFHTSISENEALLELLKKIQRQIVLKIGINPAYLIPVEQAAIPKTSIGKIQRSQLKQRFEAGEFEAIVKRIETILDAARGKTIEEVAPRTELEQQLACIWQKVLNVSTISIHDDFFELGGHSILVFQMISRLREELKIELPIPYLFQAPTVGQLSKLIEQDLQKANDTPLTAILARGQVQAPLSYMQQGLWFLDQLEGQNATYNLPLVIRLIGSLNYNYLHKAIAATIERHEALRTRLITVEGIGQQEILPAAAIDLNLIDLREFTLDERDLRVIQLAKEEARLSFDLTQGPLIRAKLLHVEDNRHVLLLTVHHIVADGWSMNMLTEELWTFYRAFMAQTKAELKPLPIQYADFALWQREHFNDTTLAPQLEYWQNQLAGIPPTLELPLDRPRSAKQTFAGNSQSFQFSQELTKKLQTLSQRSGTTLYMTVLAAFGVLMHRYSRQEDIVIGSPIANRNYREIESLIGFFVNTLALRLNLSNHPSFAALLQQVRQVTLDAYAHQDIPFSKVVEQLELERNLSYHPVFQVMFTWQNVPDYDQDLGDLSVKLIKVESVGAKFDLDVSIIKSESGLQGTFTYNTDLFDAATIERMTAHFQTLLEGIVDNPQQPIAQLPLLTTDERHQLLVEWNDTATEYPQKCIHQLFEEQVERTPDVIAVEFEGQQLTYRELNHRSNQLAHYLQKLGVMPDVLVGICIERSLEMVVALLGVLKAGGAYVPLDPTYPTERISFVLQDAQVKVLVTQKSLASRLPEHTATVVCLDGDRETIAHSKVSISVEVKPNNLAYVIYTSGSTGKPKGVLVSHKNAVNLLSSIKQKPGLTADDTFLAITTVSFDISVLEIFTPLIVGAQLVVVSREVAVDGTKLKQAINRYETTFMQATPVTWQLLVAEQSSFKNKLKIISGGEALPPDLAQKLLSMGVELWNFYGPTETTIWSTGCQVQTGERAITIGYPIANTQVYILDANLQQVPIGVPGELHIGGDGVTKGYLDRPELTEQKFISNPFSADPESKLYKTGDLARFLPNGQIECLGRIDYQVKVRGFRIELGEIEATMTNCPGVKQAIAIVREDRANDKTLVGYFVPDLETGKAAHHQISELREFLKERLPNYMVPTQFMVLDAMPLTPNGKVDRRALPAPDTSNIQLDTEFVAPSNITEEILVSIWADVLGVKQLSINDSFFELGGHSLLATQVVSRIRQAFSIEIPLQSLFENPTIASLAQTIAQCQNQAAELSKYQTISPREKRDSAPLSFAQQRLWFLAQLEPNNPFYTIPWSVRLSGDLNIPVLQQALDAIVAHHEVLHTNYISENGNPMQVVAAPRSVELPIIDLQQYGQGEQETQVQKLLQQKSQQPFDLSSDMMLRGCLLKLAPQEHILLLVMHHIAADGWSIGILWKQLTQLYQAFSEGQTNSLEKPPIQHADYAVWQREWLSGEILEQQLSYWQQQLAGAKPLLELPTDRPRPAVQTYRGASQSFILSQSLSDGLKQLGRQEGVTLYMTLLAAFQSLLYRYSRQNDIVVGSPIAGRNRVEIEGLIGCFVNTLMLRTDLSGNPSFQELLGRVRSITLDAYAHQDLPFEKLVEELNPERSLSYSPLFQVMFVLQNALRRSKQLLGLKEEPVELQAETAKFDLLLSVTEKDGILAGSWNYNTDLFDAATIERMTAHFQTLLEGIVDNPQQPIDQLPLLTTNERHQLLVNWNDTASEYPQKCIHQLFDSQAERTPDAVAVVFEKQQLTYRELNQRANQLAHYLQKLGVKPDVLVGICIERSLEMVVALLGVLKAGGAYLPLDPGYPQERISFMLQDTQVPVLLTSQNLVTKLPEYNAQVVCLDKDWNVIAQESQENLVTRVSLANLGYVIYTSGSTGNPKGVTMPQLALCNLIWWQLQNSKVSPQSKTLQFSPISFDVSFQEIFSTWSSGGTLVLIAEELRTDARALLNFLKKQSVERLFLPFVALQQLAEVVESTELVPESLREIITAGEQLQITPAISYLFSKLNNARLSNHYGPSESHVVTAFNLNGSVKNWSALPPIGRPIANTQIYILDFQLQPVPIGVFGELYIGGFGLAKGYLNRPELTAEKFIPNPFDREKETHLYKTGDLARYLKDGNIEYLGRIDNQVKIRGFRIELGEIEVVLAQHPSIAETVVIAREDLPGDKRLVAYIVPQKEQPYNSELRSFLQERLPNYMIPSVFMFLDAMPRTPSGKVDRRALPAPDAANIQLDTEFVPPSNPTEERLASIWADVLGVERVGINDNFFELGGHSLLALRLFAKIEQVFGRVFSLATLFEAPTVKDLSNIIDQKQSLAAESCLVPIQPKGSKPPLFLVHARGTSVLVYRSLATYLGTERPVYGIQPQGLNGEAEILTTVEEMAAYYLQEIKKIQPIGPYSLGGYSFGGELAFEMSRQLHQQGEKVDKLILLDSNAPTSNKRLPFSQRINIHFHNLQKRKHKYIIERALDWKRWLQDDLQYNFQKLAVKVFRYLNLPLSLKLYNILIEERNDKARANHQLKFYPGKVTLMRTQGSLGGVGRQRDEYLGWKNLVGQEIDIYSVPGHHLSMLEEPNVQQLADVLKSCLNK
jgi:amino acid adenylation domain-containing protein